jgi:hypothetical protein
MQHRLLTLLFAFLLLGMQQEAQFHSLAHLAAQLQRPFEQSVHVPTIDTACAECALLAGGASVAPNGSARFAVPDVGVAAQERPGSSWTVAAPSYYESRGPPATS